MSHNEDLDIEKTAEDAQETTEVLATADAETNAEESAEAAAPFDEEQLLALAQQQGLAEGGLEEAPVELDSPATKKALAEITDEQKDSITASIETLLFMSDKPVSLPRLRSVIAPEVPLSVFRVLMAKLREEYSAGHRGVEITEVSLGFQLRTKPHMVSILRKLVKTQPLKLSPASMEVLAVTAYKQPIPKDELDQIRGVDSGYVLRNLMEKRLIRILGRSDLPGKPMVYGTTHEFLELFSLKDLKSLPALHEVEAMVATSEIGVQEKQAEAFQDFSKMVASSTEPLFQDGELDTELESLKADISQISTSTPFIEAQKAREKEVAHLLASGQALPEGMAQPSFNPFDFQVPVTHEPSVEAGTAEAVEHIEAVTEATMAMADAPMDTEEAQAEISGEPAVETEIQALPVDQNVAVVMSDVVVEDAPELAAENAEPVVETHVEAVMAAPPAEHVPSPELETQAQEAQWERHAAVLAEAIAESQRDQLLTEAQPEQVSEEETRPTDSEKKLESEPENTV